MLNITHVVDKIVLCRVIQNHYSYNKKILVNNSGLLGAFHPD
jgi:hypothetical protein